MVTPFSLDTGKWIVLVSRGWVEIPPLSSSGEKLLPNVHPIKGDVSITGNIHVPMVTPAFLSEKATVASENTQWPLTLFHLDLDIIDNYFNRPLLSYIVRLRANERGVYERHWRTDNFNVKGHLSYAYQWFAMSFLAMLALIVINTNIVHILRSIKS